MVQQSIRMAGGMTLSCLACGEYYPDSCKNHDDHCKNPLKGRLTEVSDGSGHHYVIPLGRLDEWGAFCNLDEDDERAWEVPEWAHRIDGGRLTFRDWRIE